MKIKIDLSTSSVRDAIKQLEAYRDKLEDKNEKFVRELAKLGKPVIKSNIARASGDSNPLHHIDIITVEKTETKTSCMLTLDGEDILFFEFGAGIYYNEEDPPHAERFGYGVGTYPDQEHAFDPNGWWYRDDSDILHHSYGTEATSPMLKASHEIIANIRRIAREVYGSSN